MFSGRLSRGAYARAVAIRIGLYIAATLVLFGILWVMQETHACGNEGCMAFIGMAVALIVLPALYFLLIASFIGISVRRVRDLGLPGVLALAIPVLMLGDVLIGMTLASTVVSYFHSLPVWPIPHFLILALVCIGFLCSVQGSGHEGTEDGQRWGIPGALALGILTLSSISALFRFCDYIASVLSGLAAMQTVGKIQIYWGEFGTPILLIAMFTLVVWRQRPQTV